MRKRILILYTGGTIGMVKSIKGYIPKPGFLTDTLKKSPALQNNDVPQFDIIEYAPLIDSSNMRPRDWNSIAQDIYKHYDHYDGFLILHGTDTLTYTASALSFMLENLGKPVICSGSQIPVSELRNDGMNHILESLLILQNIDIPEVCVYFADRLMRGNRTTKVNASGMNAFTSPNFPDLGNYETRLHIRHELIATKPKEDTPLTVCAPHDPTIVSIQLFPGFKTEIIRQVLTIPVDGIVLHTFGSGNAPNNDPEFLKALDDAHQQNIVIVNITQCLRGSVHMEAYDTGSTLAKAGVISGFDMTHEAALTKLYYLFSKQLPHDQVEKQLSHPLRGELTIS